MSINLTDISNRQDLLFLMKEFYARATKDPVIGEKFEHLNMEDHIEVIVDFWNSVIFGSNTYQGDPFGKHIPLNLEAVDFTRWLELFTETVDSNFNGSNATEIMHRANTIARVFQHKLNLS